MDLVEKHDLQPEQIETIEIFTLQRAAEILADEKKYIIDSRETADHSLPYCIAAAVVSRELTTKQFSNESLKDKRILENVPKVRALCEPSFEKRFPDEQPCRVKIILTNGETFSNERSFPKGDPRDQLSNEELKRKFAGLAEDILDEAQRKEVFDTIKNLENLSEIGDLMKLLVK